MIAGAAMVAAGIAGMVACFRAAERPLTRRGGRVLNAAMYASFLGGFAGLLVVADAVWGP